jgi:hypothetical protein
MLQVETTGNVTSPVTQVEVVAVNNASRYGTDTPLAELIGKAKRMLPSKIAIIKLSKIICVVDKEILFFLITIPRNFTKKDQHPLQTACPIKIIDLIISYTHLFVKSLAPRLSLKPS